MATSSILKSADKTYTLDQFIEMQLADNMTYYNFSILEIVDNVEHLDHNIVEDYIDQLDDISIEIDLDDDQYRKYKYRPDLLAYDIYNSVQLDFVILLLNDTVDPKEFDMRKIKLPYSNHMSQFLNQVYSAEYSYMQINRDDIGKDMRI